MNKKKVIAIVVVAVLVIGGSVGAVLGVKAYNDKKEAEALAKQQQTVMDTYNNRINDIMNPLLVPDANGQNPSLDNNMDINAMNSAVSNLDNIKNEVTADTHITNEQKATLHKTIDDNINKINARIQAVQQAQAEQQAREEAERQAQAQAQAQAEASKSSSSTSNNKSRANNGGSSSSGRSSSSGSSSDSGDSSAPADSGNSGGGSGYQGVTYEEAKANAPDRADFDAHPEKYRTGGPGSW